MLKGKIAAQYGRHTPAANELLNALGTVETNEPINRRAGNVEQAKLEKQSATSFRGALHTLASDKMKMIGQQGSKLRSKYGHKPSLSAMQKAQVSRMKTAEAKLETTPTKTKAESDLEKRISTMTGVPYVGKR